MGPCRRLHWLMSTTSLSQGDYLVWSRNKRCLWPKWKSRYAEEGKGKRLRFIHKPETTLPCRGGWQPYPQDTKCRILEVLTIGRAKHGSTSYTSLAPWSLMPIMLIIVWESFQSLWQTGHTHGMRIWSQPWYTTRNTSCPCSMPMFFPFPQ